MARYSKQPIKRTVSGKRTFASTRYPKITERVSDIYIIASDADRLDTISYQVYGRPDYWWIIAVANNVGRGTLFLEEGTQLRVPTDIDPILQEFNRLNNVT